MDDATLKQALETLISVVREQHLQIQGTYHLLDTYRAAFEPAVGEKIDLFVKQYPAQDEVMPRYPDATTARLDDMLRQIQKS